MKIPSSLAITFAICTVVLCGCNSKEAVDSQASTEWRSEHFNISVNLDDGWQRTHVSSPGDTFDRPGNLLQAFLNRSGPYSYIIKVENDVPLDQLSLEDYLDANRAQYTSHPAYELIDEGAVDLHGHKFHRFRLRVDGANGPAAMYAHVFRDGKSLVSVQWTFPTGNDGELPVPSAIAEFDAGVSIDIHPQSTE